MNYRYTGTEEKHVPTFGATLKPGDEIETQQAVNHPDLEPIKEDEKNVAKTP